MKTALISLDELYLFVRVAKSHFINLVAKEEGMTPSAVSQARVGDSHDGSLGHEGAVSKSRNTQHREFAHETSS